MTTKHPRLIPIVLQYLGRQQMAKNHHGQMVFCGVVIMGCKGNYDDW